MEVTTYELVAGGTLITTLSGVIAMLKYRSSENYKAVKAVMDPETGQSIFVIKADCKEYKGFVTETLKEIQTDIRKISNDVIVIKTMMKDKRSDANS